MVDLGYPSARENLHALSVLSDGDGDFSLSTCIAAVSSRVSVD